MLSNIEHNRCRVPRMSGSAVAGTLGCIACLVVSLWSSPVPAQEFKTVSLPVESVAKGAESTLAPANFNEILRSLLLDALQAEYVDDREWRGSVTRFDGLRIQGARISKRERSVPHGIWQRYKVRLVRSEETFQVEFAQLPLTETGKIPFTIQIRLRARCEATFVWWLYGVKGVNGTAVSQATLQLRLLLETSPQVKFQLDSPLPSLKFRPQVTDVDLRLLDLDMQQFGVLQGDLVKVLGDGSTRAIEAMMRQQTGRIRTQLQKQLDSADR